MSLFGVEGATSGQLLAPRISTIAFLEPAGIPQRVRYGRCRSLEERRPCCRRQTGWKYHLPAAMFYGRPSGHRWFIGGQLLFATSGDAFG